jgi:hypothetical protein
MQRITLTGLCVWLVLGAAMALAQEESEAAPPPPEQTDRVASDDGMDPGAWQYEDEDAEEDEDFVFPHGDSDADVATGIAAASGLAMVGFMMLWFMLYFGFIMFIMVSSMAVLLATVLAIYDCARRDFPDPNTRALWCILIVMTRWMGALIYYISVYRNNDPPLQEALRQRPATTPSA